MSFILRILFTGLIAFVPNENGTEVTVLLLNVDHNHHTSDGSKLPHHNPMIVARAGNCTGDCTPRDLSVAKSIFGGDQDDTTAQDSLEAAVANGSAWALDGSDLSIEKGDPGDPDLPELVLRDDVRGTVNSEPAMIPTTSTEREDFTWIADLHQICPTCSLNSDVLGSNPPTGIVAARLRLRSGKVFTYSVARLGSDVTPVNFKRLDGTGSASSYSQAVASWVGADIEVEGDSIEIVENTFANEAGRTMTLEPGENGKVEIAVLNLPSFVPPASSSNDAPQVGKHFEAYYELADTPPAIETRLVPRAGAYPSNASYPQVDWHTIHPSIPLFSDLLNGLRMEIGRSLYDRVICPPVRDVP